MKFSSLLLGLGAVCAAAGVSAVESKPMHVFIGTYGYTNPDAGIYAATFDPATGALTQARKAAPGNDPSFLALSKDGRHLYASGSEGPKGFVSAYSVDGDKGTLALLNRQPNGHSADCHVALTPAGTTLLAANYGDGAVSAFPIQADGSLGARSFFAQHHGTGPNTGRQEAPHAHAFTPDNAGAFAFAPDLGADKLFAYRLGSEPGAVTAVPALDISTTPGHGPRHLAFSPAGLHAYELDELTGTVRVYAYAPATGRLSFAQEISSLPADYKGPAGSAEIVVHPNGRFLYASNRENHQSVAVFAIKPADGTLTLVQHFQADLVHPRFIGLDPTAKWLLITNTFGNSIVVAPVDAETGRIGAVVSKLEVPGPSAIVFAGGSR